MRLLRAADEANRGQAVAPVVERVMGGLHDLGMIGQPEVVVRTHVQQAVPPLTVTWGCWAVESTRSPLKSPALLDLVELAGEMLFDRAVHRADAPSH